MQPIEGFSVLVTGGGSGLGAAVARHMAARGARVTICGRRAERLAAVARDIGPNCHAEPGDIARAGDRARIVAAALAHGGGLQGLVNAAANMLQGEITALEEARLLDILHVNVVAGMMMTGLCVPHLARDGGAVVFFGSVHARRSFPRASPYAASKGAVEVLARVLAAELGPKGIRVNCIIPGAVPTEINVRAGLATPESNLARLKSMEEDHPLGRIGRPEEIAEAVDYLLRAQWTTGAALVVDGGLSLGMSRK
ncbi:MAG: dehydrogenase [Paracoccaceae bacterium]|nr:MAG: SDR family oxidoreductase [Alphaproteobacteria bacterium]GIX14887.1 MAG: dehydrogenase [Paracoccaceae bacterium]